MEIICASICYRGFENDEVAATLKYAPKIGYRLMEIHGPMVWSYEAVAAFNLPAVKSAIERSGMSCAGIYTPGWGGKDDTEVSRQAAAIAACVRYAQALGADHVTSTGVLKRDNPGGLEQVVACVCRVLEQIPADAQVRLVLEPHYGNTLQGPEDFARVLDEIPDPRVGVCVDTGHFHSAGVDTVSFIKQFAPRIYNVHLKDHVGKTSVGIGRGEIDLKPEIAALQDVGYSGDLTVELEVSDPNNLPRYAEEAYIYLSGMLGKKLH